jgi:MFS family permease
MINDSDPQIGGGLISDVWKPEDRGKALSLYLLAPVLGPVVGPLAGAWIAQTSDWRWIFWGSTILCAAIQAVGVFLLDESLSESTSWSTVHADAT